MMKMKDIAELAGVSMATVSRVINHPEKVRLETRLKVEKILEETKFVANAVARGLVVNSMKTIGVLAIDIRNLYFSNVTYSIERSFTELGYNVLLSNTGFELGEKKKYLKVMLEKQVDGLILVGSVFREKSDNEHIIEASTRVPVVLVNSYLPGDNIYSVLCDDSYGVKEAVNYLIGLGHRDIYYFQDSKSFSGLAKRDGFVEGMSAHGLDADNIIEVRAGLEGGREGVSWLIAEGRKFTAIITGEDITAVGCMKAISDMGLNVPGDVAVVGYDNSMLTEICSPTLTSVDSMGEAMAREAVQTLYGVLQGHQVSRRIVLSPTLVIRESSEGRNR